MTTNTDLHGAMPELPEPDTTWYASWANDRVKFHSTDQIYEFANTRVRAAIEQAAVPEGWKLVPVEPTEAMQIAAGRDSSWCHTCGYDNGGGNPADSYGEMLAASPAPPKQQESLPEGLVPCPTCNQTGLVTELLDVGYRRAHCPACNGHGKVAPPKQPPDSVLQAITDPENQPSQYGTVTLEFHLGKIAEWESRFDRATSQQKVSGNSVHLGGGEVGGVPLTYTQRRHLFASLDGSVAMGWIGEDECEELKARFNGITAPAPRPSAPTGQINPGSVAQGKEADHG